MRVRGDVSRLLGRVVRSWLWEIPEVPDFSPERVSKGSDIHVLSGTKGELVKINRQGHRLGSVVTPFPTPIIDLPLDVEWEEGASREELRSAINSQGGADVIPSNSLWHRVLDAEPMKMGKSGGNVVFATGSGVYMINSHANEVWRGMIPRWPSISNISGYDEIVGIVEFSGGVSIWSKAGGVSVLDPSNGLEIFSRVMDFGDTVAGVTFSDDGGWFVMLHEGSIALMDEIEGEFQIYKTGGPVLDAEFYNGEWRWTGWRQDGHLSSSGVEIYERENVGVGIIDGRILANDGSRSEWASTRPT